MKSIIKVIESTPHISGYEFKINTSTYGDNVINMVVLPIVDYIDLSLIIYGTNNS